MFAGRSAVANVANLKNPPLLWRSQRFSKYADSS
jgi:hypothetical protein